jgi:hypothetical protein
MNTPACAQDLNLRCGCEVTSNASLARFYSRIPVFIDEAHAAGMRKVIEAVRRVTALPDYQSRVLAQAPVIARLRQASQGVFTGFDFHVGGDGPRLIEINTNAGGAMLNAAADWRRPECAGIDSAISAVRTRAQLEQDFWSMFIEEWRLARGGRPLRTIAIVDDQPEQQFLFPEFQLFAELFTRQGVEAFIADAAELEIVAGSLSWRGKPIDLVYNRVTDFYLQDAAHAALRQAYEADLAVITPHPRAHALLADKDNLVRLTDAEFLSAVGAAAADIATLREGIPPTHRVQDDESWWRNRKNWFFKPSAGFGSRGAYRGDKLTRRVFAEIVRGGYVAQQMALPGERRGPVPGETPFKVDIRNYVYDGQVQLLAARLYQGQTSNFRTAGGGFAPILQLRDEQSGRELLRRCAHDSLAAGAC